MSIQQSALPENEVLILSTIISSVRTINPSLAEAKVEGTGVRWIGQSLTMQDRYINVSGFDVFSAE
jgi:hypothetical protein